MGRIRLHIGGAVCLLVVVVLAAAFGPPAEAGKKVRVQKSAKMKEYDPVLSVGDKRIYWITYRGWGIENVTGSEESEGFTNERVAGPFERNGVEDVYKLYSPGLYQEFYTVKKGKRLLFEAHDGSSTWVYKKPVKNRRKMRFGRTYKGKVVYQYTDLDGELEDAWVIRTEENVAENGREWSGEWLDFDDTIVVTSDYLAKTGDALDVWNGIETKRFARGIGLVRYSDEYVYEYRLYGLFGTYKIGYEITMELAYANIDGVEYGDPNVDD